MKTQRLMIIAVLIALLFFLIAVNHSIGADWKGSIRTYKTIPSDSGNKVQSGYGLQVNLHCNDWYFYISQDKNPIRFGGQSGQDVKLQSVGFGFTHNISKHFSFFADIGWYHPEHDSGIQEFPKTQLAEGLFYHLNTKLGITHLWDYYTIEYHGALGGKLGFEFSKPISKNWFFSLSTAYRYLQLGEMIQGRDFGNTTGWWEWKEDRDFGGWQVGAAITYSF